MYHFIFSWNNWEMYELWYWTHLGERAGVSGPSGYHICYTHWSRAAGRHLPAPRPARWWAPPYSKQSAAWALQMSGGQCEIRYSEIGEARQHSGDAAEHKGRRHPTSRRKHNNYRYIGSTGPQTWCKLIYLNALENHSLKKKKKTWTN